MPLLIRDASRLSEAYLLRAGASAAAGRRQRLGRAATLTRALGAGALERSVELAAALEVRGYGGLGRFPASREPWSVDDLGFASSAAALTLACSAAAVAGLASFEPYPLIRIDVGLPDLAFAAALPLLSMIGFVPGRRRRG